MYQFNLICVLSVFCFKFSICHLLGALSNDYGRDQGVTLQSHSFHTLREVSSFHTSQTSTNHEGIN